MLILYVQTYTGLVVNLKDFDVKTEFYVITSETI